MFEYALDYYYGDHHQHTLASSLVRHGVLELAAHKGCLRVTLLYVLDEPRASPLLGHHLEGEPEQEGERKRAQRDGHDAGRLDELLAPEPVAPGAPLQRHAAARRAATAAAAAAAAERDGAVVALEARVAGARAVQAPPVAAAAAVWATIAERAVGALKAQVAEAGAMRALAAMAAVAGAELRGGAVVAHEA